MQRDSKLAKSGFDAYSLDQLCTWQKLAATKDDDKVCDLKIFNSMIPIPPRTTPRRNTKQPINVSRITSHDDMALLLYYLRHEWLQKRKVSPHVRKLRSVQSFFWATHQFVQAFHNNLRDEEECKENEWYLYGFYMAGQLVGYAVIWMDTYTLPARKKHGGARKRKSHKYPYITVDFFQIFDTWAGRGMGKQCVTVLEQEMKEKYNCRKVTLRPLTEARGFWYKCGYRSVMRKRHVVVIIDFFVKTLRSADKNSVRNNTVIC